MFEISMVCNDIDRQNLENLKLPFVDVLMANNIPNEEKWKLKSWFSCIMKAIEVSGEKWKDAMLIEGFNPYIVKKQGKGVTLKIQFADGVVKEWIY